MRARMWTAATSAHPISDSAPARCRRCAAAAPGVASRLGGILYDSHEFISTVANSATGAMMLWLLFFLLPVFAGLTFIIIDWRRAGLRDCDDTSN